MALDDERAHAVAGQLDGRDEAGRAGADDEDVADVVEVEGDGAVMAGGSSRDLVVQCVRCRTVCPMKYTGVNMDKRRYRQSRRAESAEATRGRILDAARANLERGPVGALKVDEVARDAGVARSTVYVLFGSRAGPVRRAGPRAARLGRVRGAHRRLAAARRHRQPAGVAAGGRGHVRPSARPGPRRCSRWPPSTRTASPRSRPSRTAGARACVAWPRRSTPRAICAAGLPIDEAVDLLTVITSFQSFDELFTGSGLPADTVADRLIALAERSVCRSDLPPWLIPVSCRRRPATHRPGGGRSPA